jgi:hypothetical protein
VVIACNRRCKDRHQTSTPRYLRPFQMVREAWNHSIKPILNLPTPTPRHNPVMLPTHLTNLLMRVMIDGHQQRLLDMAKPGLLIISISNTAPFLPNAILALKQIQFHRYNHRTLSTNLSHKLRRRTNSPLCLMPLLNLPPSRPLSLLIQPHKLIMLLHFIFKIRTRGRRMDKNRLMISRRQNRAT